MENLTTHGDSKTALFCGVAAGVVVALIYSAWISVRIGFDKPPSTSGDEVSYDSMAWQLSSGDGFSLDCSRPEFRAPYERAAEQQPELFTLTEQQPGLIAYRPPLFSLVFAATNVCAGRQFYLIRLFNVGCMAATAGLLMWFLTQRTNWKVALVCLFVFVIDVRSRLYARAILTEPLACLLCTLLIVLLISIGQRRASIVPGIVAGLLTGLSVLTRTITIVWIPGVLFLTWTQYARTGHARPVRVRQTVLVAVIATAVTSPWAVRNTLVLGRFAPTGTQGQVELSAGYSDIAWQHGGVWQNLRTHGFFDGVVTPQMSRLEAELALADKSVTEARQWIAENATCIPVLAAMKVGNEIRPRSIVECFVLVLSFVGLVVGRSDPSVRVLGVMIAVNLLAVAATWSVEGRFLVPQLFAFYALAGLGLNAIVKRIRRTGTAGGVPTGCYI